VPVSDNPIRRVAPSELEAGDELSARYRIVRRLGAGGMGAVYEAEQIKLRKRVALKIMHPERAQRDRSAKRFIREARAASAIKHRNVVEILDFGELEDQTTYLVMELLHGTDLSSLLKREGPMAWPRARMILLQVLRGLKAAHDAKIIHRDIKPANIFLLDPDDEYAADDRVKVLDFGIAHVELSEDETQQLTDTSEMLGTVTYMAPELARKGQASAQSDLYAVGIMAYKMLTGMTPFGGGTGLQILYAHVHDEPPAPRSLEPSIPEAVEAVILRTLAKQPEDRFEGADALARALASIDDDGKVTSAELSDILRTPTIPPLSPSPASMSKPIDVTGGVGAGGRMRWVLGVVVVGLVLVFGIGFGVWFASGGKRGEGDAVPDDGMAAGAVVEGGGANADEFETGSGGASRTISVTGMTGPVGDTGDTGDTGEGESTSGDAAGSSSGGAQPEVEATEDRPGRGKKKRRRKIPSVVPESPSGAELQVVRRRVENASRKCGASTLAKNIEIEFTVGPGGRVGPTDVKGLEKGTLVASCVVKALKRQQFPQSRQGMKSKTWTLPLR